MPSRRRVIGALGLNQILGWGSSYYLPAVLAAPIVADTGWSLGWVVGGLSVGMLVAGLVSPWIGGAIERKGGRPVLAASSVLFALGLAGIGLAPVLGAYMIAWIVVGLGMGAGLYDSAFAALGRLYGQAARGAIASLTLFGGFASTVCWPLSAYLADAVGWRGTCLVYAGLHLALACPLYLWAIPKDGVRETGVAGDAPAHTGESISVTHARLVFVTLAAILALAAGIGSAVSVHLLTFLQARGLELAVAVSLGTLLGPAQVGARAIERILGRHYHPIWTAIAACVLMAAGLVLLLVDLPIVAFAIVLYAAGFGISWIARGTVPLALFGSARYPRMAGRLALPGLVAQALTPWLAALLIDHAGVRVTLAVLAGLALANVALIASLWIVYRRNAGALPPQP